MSADAHTEQDTLSKLCGQAADKVQSALKRRTNFSVQSTALGRPGRKERRGTNLSNARLMSVDQRKAVEELMLDIANE